jgi:hypothetical protein
VGFFGQIRSSVNSVLPRLFDDPDLPVSVTWKVFTSSIFDPDLGVNVEVYTDFEITAIRIEKEIGSIQTKTTPPGPWTMAIGDVVYLFKYIDVPSGASIRDNLVDGEYTYGIKRILPVFNLITKVEVKGYA